MDLTIQSIFSGMPSLLIQQQIFSEQWPIAKLLPPLSIKENKQQKCDEWLENIPELRIPNISEEKRKKRIRIKKSREISKCPHKERKHYAQLMCNACYHAKAREVKATQCEHKESMMYAKGKCLKCYQKTYKKEKRRFEKKMKLDPNELR